MAILSSSELSQVRQACALSFTTVAYTKPPMNAALQAIEDAMTTRLVAVGDVGKTWPQVLSDIIDAASSPFVFTTAQKKVLFALWAELKFKRDK